LVGWANLITGSASLHQTRVDMAELDLGALTVRTEMKGGRTYTPAIFADSRS
jgi:hypothetical protein